MIQQVSRPTAFRDKIDHEFANLLVEIERDGVLRAWMVRLCHVLASSLTTVDGFPIHPIYTNRHAGLVGVAIARLEQDLLHLLTCEIEDRLPKLYAAYENEMPHILRRYALMKLENDAPSQAYRERVRDKACKEIPLSFTRLPNNPVRLIQDPITGVININGEDFHLASPKQLLDIKSLQRIFEPARPVGRQKGSAKPASSGRKPSVGQDVYIEAWEAKQQHKKNESIPWWRTFARNKNIPIPQDPKAEGALRKKLEEWAIKGKSLSRKKQEI